MRWWLCAWILVTMACPARAQPAQTPLNTTCPVMQGEPVDPDMWVDHEGTRVWLCCKKCKARFERNPTIYLAVLPQFGGTPAPAQDDPESQPVDVPAEDAPATRQPEPPRTEASPTAAAIPPAPASFRVRAADFLGRLHPVSVHFPVGLLITAAFLELLAILFRAPRAGQIARPLLVLGAIGAALSAGLGWINAEFNPFQGELASTLTLHRWLGVGVAGASVLCVILMLIGDRARPAFRVALLSSALMVAVTGYLGGDLVRGPNHLFAGLWNTPAASRPAAGTVRAPVPSDDREARPLEAAAGSPAPAALDRLIFAANNEDAFIARREVRLASVEPPEEPAASAHPIDHFIEAAWRRAGLPEADRPPELCHDAAFVRRAYLDVIGVIPTIEEADRFLSSTDPDKRRRLIDELLARDADYAAHWTPFWEDALGSANTELQGGVPTRGNYRKWIEDSFRDNTPFDVLAAELIDPAMPGHKAAVGANANGKVSKVAYIKSETHVDTMQSAANVAQVFLGTSMKCASCHSHFENDEWPQQRFLAFAGMFAGNDLEVIRCEARTGEIVRAAFPFELPGMPSDVPADADGRLRRVAQLLTDPLNPRFARAIVNRLWKRYMGLGLFEPVDDFRLDRPPSHPDLLDWLAYDFMTHGYDLKHTIRVILTSRTYQTRYDAALADVFDVNRPDQPRYFRSPSLRRLTAEQAIDSVRVATMQGLEPASRLYLDTASTALTRSLGKPASRNEISTGRPDDVAVVQALELLNGGDYHALVYTGTLMAELAHLDAGAAADRLYRAVLARPPTDDERRLAVEYIGSALDREPAAGPAAAPVELVFIDDELPDGARVSAPGGWPWATDWAFQGSRSHHQPSEGKQVQHYVLGASRPSPVGPADTLVTHVYIDPDDPPRQIMVQWNDGGGYDGGWAHRAYWGEDLIMYGVAESPSRRRLGPLPEAGRWVRLEVPASQVGFTRDGTLSGMSFDQVGGSVWWDASGILHVPHNPASAPLGDLMWALFTSPEFQYLR